MKRRLIIIFLAILILNVGVLGTCLVQLSLPANDMTQELHIIPGTPSNKIIHNLAEKEIIKHPFIFKIYLMITRQLQNIRAGDYEFPPSTSAFEVARMLRTGDFKTYTLTLVEGWNLDQVAGYLEERGLADPKLFLALCQDPNFIQSLQIEGKSLEGYLFPDTYETYSPISEEDLIQKFVARFHEVYTPEWRQRTKEMEWTVKQVVTLASIVEKETGAPEERPLIASVFHNRLKKNMRLETDPTVIYGVPNFNGNLTRRHLETHTPYNTYMIAGLPPGPIANPGSEAIKAVLYPAQSNYLFFVSKNNGTHYFSTNMRDHGRAVRKYQILRQKD
jgi:UPF0755 protein